MKDVINIISLDKLEMGKDAVVEAVNCNDAALRKHIFDMGLTPGVEISLIKTAPMGDPIEIKLRGYILTLRKEDASKIIIKNIHNSEDCPKKIKNLKIHCTQK